MTARPAIIAVAILVALGCDNQPLKLPERPIGCPAPPPFTQVAVSGTSGTHLAALDEKGRVWMRFRGVVGWSCWELTQ